MTQRRQERDKEKMPEDKDNENVSQPNKEK